MYCCTRTELITLNPICPSTHQLLQSSGGDSGPDLSFDKSASPECLLSLARVSLTGLSKLPLSSRCSVGDYTSSCPPSLVSAKLALFAFLFLRSFAALSTTLPDPFHFFPLKLVPWVVNKELTFEVLCRSLQIEPTPTLFRVFQMLCKQGDWFLFAKRRAPSPVCIDDNRSCMKDRKSGFFLVDQRAIPDSMVWRHLSVAIDDPRPAASSFSMADVCRLSAHVIKLRDMPEGVLVLSGLSRVWKSRVCDPVLHGADGNVMGIHDFLYLPEWTSAEDLAVGTPSAKILVKAEASQKRKASTSGATSSYVVKRTRSALDQSSSSTTRPSLFVGDFDDESDGDDDACVEIPLVTLIRSAAMIPSSENQGGSSAAPTAEGPSTRDSRGKGIMVDDADAPSVGVSRPRPSSSPVPSFRDVFEDAIHVDFFPFSAGPYYVTYPEGGVARNYEFTREE
ncbi:hypothetical protein Tco_1355413 [Tanacetum coccineum]